MGAMAILVMIIVLCCFFRCRIPRTKQEIEADVARKKVTKRFRAHLEKLPVDKMELDKVLPEVIDLEAKRLKRGEIEQKKTLFQKIKAIFFDPTEEEEDEDDDEVSKATVSFEEGTEVAKKGEDGGGEDDDEEFEDETESTSEYDEHGDKVIKEKKRRRKKIDENLKGLRTGDNSDTSSEESKRIKKQYLSLSYKQSSSTDAVTAKDGEVDEKKIDPLKGPFEKKKNNTFDSVNITIDEENEEDMTGVKPEDIESALERLRIEHMKRELQGKSSSTESRKSDNGKPERDGDGRSHSLPDKSGRDRKLSEVVGKTIVKQKTCAAIIEHAADTSRTGSPTTSTSKKSSPKASTSKKSSPKTSTSKLALPPMSTFKGPIIHAVSTPVSPSATLIRQSSRVKPVPPPKPSSLTLLRSPQGSKDGYSGGPLSPSGKHPQLSRQVELAEVEALKLSSDGSKQSSVPIYEEVTKKKKTGKKKVSSTSSSTSSTTKCSCGEDHSDDDSEETEESASDEEEDDTQSTQEEKRTKF